MYRLTENIYCSQLSSVGILLQPEPVSHRIIQGKDCVLSPSVLSPCGLPLPPTCLLQTANEARSYFASTVRLILQRCQLLKLARMVMNERYPVKENLKIEHVACIEGIRNAYNVLVAKPKWKIPLTDLGVNGSIILKRSLTISSKECELHSPGSG
jgi:hypothetical protein